MCHGMLCFLVNYWQKKLIQRNDHIVSGFIDSHANKVTAFCPCLSYVFRSSAFFFFSFSIMPM